MTNHPGWIPDSEIGTGEAPSLAEQQVAANSTETADWSADEAECHPGS